MTTGLHISLDIFVAWCDTLIVVVIPFSTLTLLNGLICRRLLQASKQRLAMRHQQPSEEIMQETAITRMLLTVVVVYIVCYMSLAVKQVNYYLTDKDGISQSRWRSVLIHISVFTMTLNSCVNFVIYFLMAKEFRTCFLKILRIK